MLITPLVKRIFSVLCKVLPIKNNRIMFIAYHGKEFSCNPRAMYEYIKSQNTDFEFVLLLNDLSEIPDDTNVIKVHFKNHFMHWYYQITAKYLFENSEPDYTLKRKGSIWINTWHGGGAFKKINCGLNMNRRIEKQKKRSGECTDIYVSSSNMFTELHSQDDFVSRDKFVSTGMPRNDVFFNAEKVSVINNKVRLYFNLSPNDFVVLYAPTYRGLQKTQKYNLNFDFNSAHKRFCELSKRNVRFLFRAHRSMLHSDNAANSFIIDATSYPDMQDLLCTADFLITDYSSAMWDYSFLYKPCLLFTPDLPKYQKERGFYTPIETWPYYFFQTNEEFIKNISFTVNKEKIEQYHQLLGSYETGHACEKLWQICQEKGNK